MNNEAEHGPSLTGARHRVHQAAAAASSAVPDDRSLDRHSSRGLGGGLESRDASTSRTSPVIFRPIPVMPGVLIVEAMAQAAGALVVHTLGLVDQLRVVYFMTIDKARFRRPVHPGVDAAHSGSGSTPSRPGVALRGQSLCRRRTCAPKRNTAPCSPSRLLSSHVRAAERQGLMPKIHASAIVEDGATLGADVEIGPYSLVGARVRLGDGVRTRVACGGLGRHRDRCALRRASACGLGWRSAISRRSRTRGETRHRAGHGDPRTRHDERRIGEGRRSHRSRQPTATSWPTAMWPMIATSATT